MCIGAFIEYMGIYLCDNSCYYGESLIKGFLVFLCNEEPICTLGESELININNWVIKVLAVVRVGFEDWRDIRGITFAI